MLKKKGNIWFNSSSISNYWFLEALFKFFKNSKTLEKHYKMIFN